jgi:hypothetical protein
MCGMQLPCAARHGQTCLLQHDTQAAVISRQHVGSSLFCPNATEGYQQSDMLTPLLVSLTKHVLRIN